MVNENTESLAPSLDLAELPRPLRQIVNSWQRGLLSLACLRALQGNPCHGYAVIQTLKTMGLNYTAGTVYPVLNSLENSGMLRSQWQAGEGGPGRKVYELTAGGTLALETLNSLWQSQVENFNATDSPASKEENHE